MIDLHIHSSFSDGTYTPEQLVEMIYKKKSLKIVSLTDHDTLAGLPRFIDSAKQKNVTAIPGIELSVNYFHSITNKEINIHILGYGIDIESQKFQKFLNNLIEMRYNRCKKMIDKYNHLNYKTKISYDEVFNKVDMSCGRPHLALVMVEKGIVKSVQEAFDLFLDYDKPCYVPKHTINLEEGASFLKQFCKMTSIAHPAQFWPPDTSEMQEDFYKVTKLGYDAIELYHYSNKNPKYFEWFYTVAHDYSMYLTGGSDFHGEKVREIGLGDYTIPEKSFNQYKHLLLNDE